MLFAGQAALVLGFFALGLSLACVYTRYHHSVDVAAGFTAALVSALISYKLTASKTPTK